MNLSMFSIFFLLASISVCSGNTIALNNNQDFATLVDSRERSILENPFIGAIMVKFLAVIRLFVYVAFYLVGFKVALMLILANIVFWVFNNLFFVTLGSVSVFGFCKLTGKCSINLGHNDHKKLVDDEDYLTQSSKRLAQGFVKYGDNHN